MEEQIKQLKWRLAEISDLSYANLVLSWDQTTYMPSGGAEARGRQMATLGRLGQEKQTDAELGRLLDVLLPYAESLPDGNDEKALIRVAKRDYDKMTKVPPDFMSRMFQHQALSYQKWTEARPQNDFKKIQPFLEKTLELSREFSNFFPGYEHVADPLIDMADFGMKARTVREVFGGLRKELVPIVQAITSQPLADDACLKQKFPEDAQLAFGEEVVRKLGYDFNRGRQDKTHHPFTTKFSIGDVRITTRVNEDNFGDAFFSTIHEGGHAMYEQGINPAYEASSLDGGTSAGVHESQSRLWENLVARSKEFWSFYYPLLQKRFPSQLANVSLDTFYRAINKVQRSLIRTDADEVTYNLHVMVRFELELELLEGKLEVRHLPEAWKERYRSDLGILPSDDKDGCMQDVHWYAGVVGGSFQGYTLGNILSALFYSQALKASPGIPDAVAHGQFGSLLTWLQQNIYRYGRKYTAPELIEKVTGGPLRFEPYIAYLKNKYGELYDL